MWGAMATSTEKKMNIDNNDQQQQLAVTMAKTMAGIREHIGKPKRRQLDNEIRYLIFKIVGKCYRWSRDCATTLIKMKPVIFNRERVCLWAWMGQGIYAVFVVVVHRRLRSIFIAHIALVCTCCMLPKPVRIRITRKLNQSNSSQPASPRDYINPKLNSLVKLKFLRPKLESEIQ